MSDRPSGQPNISTGDGTGPRPSLREVFDEEKARRVTWRRLTVALVAALTLAVIVLSILALHLASKSSEQTKAEVQLRATNASQQTTIQQQQQAIASFSAKHNATIAALNADAAKVMALETRLLENASVVDFVIIDAIDGNRVALQRDLASLARLEPPLP